MNIALFADVHGRILLALKLCARWQRETGEQLDLILQAGDMGIFAAHERLDSATIRYAAREPTELGFLQDFRQRSDDPQVAETLAQLACDFIFVRGNHEDHNYLDELEQAARGPTFAVDAYGRLLCLKTGELLTVAGRDEAHITVLGIGRIGPTSDRPRQQKPTHVQPYEEAKLTQFVASATPVDVLLTHDAPPRASGGIPVMRTILDRAQPSYHFYGHIGGPCSQGIDANGVTQYCKLADLEWHGAGQVVRPGSMAILRWQDAATHVLEVVDAAWFHEYSTFTWRYL